MRKRKGFTLIELMIVIAIIAILAAVLVPNFMRAREASRLTACKSNLKNISTAAETYAADYNGVYPGAAGSEKEVKSGEGNGLGTLANNYLQKELKCPVKPNYYKYTLTTDGVAYWIYCPARGNTTPQHVKNNRGGGPGLDSRVGIVEW